MELHIDTSTNDYIRLALFRKGELVLKKQEEAKYKQSEKLLIAIDRLLKKADSDIHGIEKVVVNDEGEGFSALRIGIVTANALAYALGVECISKNGNNKKIKDYTIVSPKYSEEPNIS